MDISLEKVEAVLDGVRPMIRKDGGDVELVRIDGTTVVVRLTGACVGCPFSTYTLKLAIEASLKAEIPAITQVKME